MKFACLVALVPDELEEKVRNAAKEAGAAGVTIVPGRGSSSEEKKSFFGLTYEGAQSILLYVLERKLSIKVIKAIKIVLESTEDSRGIVFSVPIEHLSGLNNKDLERFENQIKQEI